MLLRSLSNTLFGFSSVVLACLVFAGCGGSVAPTPVATTPTATTGANPVSTPAPAPPSAPTPAPAPSPTPPPGTSPVALTGVSIQPPSGAPPLCAVSYQGLDVPNAKSTSINGLNNTQTMVGSFADKNNVQHGFIYSNQQFTTVDGPASGQTTSGGGLTLN